MCCFVNLTDLLLVGASMMNRLFQVFAGNARQKCLPSIAMSVAAIACLANLNKDDNSS